MGIQRRILGGETILLIDGQEKEVKIWSIGMTEKNAISTKHRERIVVGTGNNKTMAVDVHDDLIINDILNLSFQGQIIAEDLDESMAWVYNKYFNKDAYVGKEKKSNTSESSEVVAEE